MSLVSDLTLVHGKLCCKVQSVAYTVLCCPTRCAVLSYALFCAVLRAVLCCAVLHGVLSCAVLRYVVLCFIILGAGRGGPGLDCVADRCGFGCAAGALTGGGENREAGWLAGRRREGLEG